MNYCHIILPALITTSREIQSLLTGLRKRKSGAFPRFVCSYHKTREELVSVPPSFRDRQHSVRGGFKQRCHCRSTILELGWSKLWVIMEKIHLMNWEENSAICVGGKPRLFEQNPTILLSAYAVLHVVCKTLGRLWLTKEKVERKKGAVNSFPPQMQVGLWHLLVMQEFMSFFFYFPMSCYQEST